jgi:pilus assembly protein CpaE
MPKASAVAVVVSPNRSIQAEIESALGQGSLAQAIWVVSDYPELSALERLREADPGCVLFLDFSDPVRARTIATELDRSYPLVSVVAIQPGENKGDLISLMQLGIREVISSPISKSEAAVVFLRAAGKLKPSEAGDGHIYAFLPAKPGAGATTVAISTAFAVARISKQRTLLLDFDLQLGVTSFLLGLDGQHSLQDALHEAVNLDDGLWQNLVSRRDNLDILGSAPVDVPSGPSASAYMTVLNCAQARYAAICVDLPGTMEPHEREILDRAKEIFLVCTADVTGLHMAKRKVDTLKTLDLREKLVVVVNHAERRTTVRLADIEKLLQVPVRFSLPTDQKAVTKAAQLGEAISSGSPLAEQIEEIAKSIVGTSAGKISTGSVRRFIEFFSVSPIREAKWKD